MAKIDKRKLPEIHIDIGSHNENPAPRIGTARPRRKSQITGKTPSKRLVQRRQANKKPGYFPNPIGSGVLAIHLNAGNDTSGNPRRLYVVVNTNAEVQGVYEEGYIGSSAVTDHYPNIGIVGQFYITPGEYRDLKKRYKAAGKYHVS